ncbi:MAG TPA: transcription elongation factor GreA [Alphaproteobacteria bacterium]|nr:transcription elongation factor GreA [Micavibrio sp.]MBK9561545.1 transcription elongation factor GreA [Micavibrio sp.]HQX28199.1 transcription elongation factor GreA [Alphaproteobacteria bacterium]
MEKIPMTPQGLKDLEAELKNLKSVQRPAVIEAIATARAHGDLSENAEYHAAKEQQSFIEGRIKELDAVTSKVQIIDPATMSGNVVKFGATVLIIDEETDAKETYMIVGEYEANAEKKRISITAPIARALIGKSVGDSVEVRAPGGKKSYEIAEVNYR